MLRTICCGVGVLVLSACPRTVVSTKPLVSVVVDVEGRCEDGGGCDFTPFLSPAFKPPTSSFGDYSTPNGTSVLFDNCGKHPIAIASYSTRRHDAVGGIETSGFFWSQYFTASDPVEMWSSWYKRAVSADENDTFTAVESQYALFPDGGVDRTPEAVYPHDAVPLSIDGGTLVYELRLTRLQSDGGFETDPNGLVITETHVITTSTVELTETYLDECPSGFSPPPSTGGWY